MPHTPVEHTEGIGEVLVDESEADVRRHQNYIAMALPLLHMLQQRNIGRAEAIARQMVGQWGDGAGAVQELLKLLESSKDGQLDEENEDEDAISGESEEEEAEGDERELSDSTEDSSDDSGCENEDGSVQADTVTGEGVVLTSLREILERIRANQADVDVLGPSPVSEENGGLTPLHTGKEQEEEEEEEETEEERRIFGDIERAVRREMDRLSLVRKHR
ncbi:hypothetical protein ERJ75_001018300 [Trypanosoma vivax]|uniref:Uncharacterized protein n=1 Tax=Trypanosoma vivax (strain Y486) TaxID=1055687 RepID=G0U2B4_TRYVY|nr:hypothetical protein TRVL_06639 [Trypanosoma vivax]KAH8611156.1 hypothetical protein ERJ75_001018300 [Trypanosoma vivax]CCC50417.1 conserved hypothetical protein [Trypanosoma vivax Y486]